MQARQPHTGDSDFRKGKSLDPASPCMALDCRPRGFPIADAIGPATEAKRSRQAPPTHEVDVSRPLHSHTSTQHAEGSLQTPR